MVQIKWTRRNNLNTDMNKKKITLEVTERELLILHGSVSHINMHRYPEVNCKSFAFEYTLCMNHDELMNLVNKIEKTYKEKVSE